MKTKGMTKAAAILLAMLMFALTFTACGSKEIKLNVIDKGAHTEVDATVGMTVEEVLKKAEITVGEKDETEPKQDEKITEDTKEILVKRYAKVVVKLDKDSKTVELVGGKVSDAIAKSGFKTEGYTPDVDKDKYLEDGMTITLVKGNTVSLTVDGKTTDYPTKAKTVEEFLKEQKVELGKDDEVSEKLDAEIKDGMKITVKRVEYKTEEKTEKVEFKKEEVLSDALDEGASELTQKGVDGEKTVTYKVKYVDGKEESREKTEEKVTKEPVNQIVTKGTKAVNRDYQESEQSSQQSQESPQPQQSEEQKQEEPAGKTVVSKQNYPDCDGSGHGYYEITYSDGTTEIQEY